MFVTVVVIRRRSERSRSFRLYSGTCPAHPVEREEKREEEWQEDGGREEVGEGEGGQGYGGGGGDPKKF